MTNAAKERPILFSAPMVRALLDGRKTQTRRLIKGHKYWGHGVVSARELSPGLWRLEGKERIDRAIHGNDVRFVDVRCRYGVPGDELWVRETWQDSPDGTIYRATKEQHGACEPGGDAPWRPSIFMPRSRSRLTLVVQSVRVERLSAITEADAIAEGFCRTPAGTDDDGARFDGLDARDVYVAAFRAMNKLAADADPWVWVVTFEKAPT